MCKLAMFPSIPATVNPADIWAFARAIARPMTAHDRDGFGYAAIADDALACEAWTDTATALRPLPALPDALTPYAAALRAPEYPGGHKAHGASALDRPVRALLLHSRWATSGKGIVNAHPHVHADTALVHNGVVQERLLVLKRSTCDSEGILNAYLHADTATQGDWQPVVDRLDGYYACGVLARDGRDRWVCDVVRDARASLHAVYVPRLQCAVLVTVPDHVTAACTALGWPAPSPAAPVRDCVALRVDVDTGDVLSVRSIAPRAAATQVSASVLQGSLGTAEADDDTDEFASWSQRHKWLDPDLDAVDAAIMSEIRGAKKRATASKRSKRGKR